VQALLDHTQLEEGIVLGVEEVLDDVHLVDLDCTVLEAVVPDSIALEEGNSAVADILDLEEARSLD